ncbi:hypothetical protein BDB00DRAFT_963364 [Zychaea mexicana]|uniref:uncharacterized protein n=1 Tax=Zychaea mexicana TaxID=64656 RepID=UPI0022FDBE03|nr:uncharacterized protein BDB00DRAFT_963364 [Zychaea mexicana]KAI9488723.1 hypothetical protein BDB00DRAFT_963364 [Zychaea mexicana]
MPTANSDRCPTTTVTTTADDDSLPSTLSHSQQQSRRASKAIRCAYGDCTDKAVKIIGECRYCESKYCGRHRLPEAHACDNITSCRQDAYDKNTSKLLRERCVANKV